MQERFKCFDVRILDYYNITVHSLVCNKSRVYCTINTSNSASVDADTVCKSFRNVRNEEYGSILQAIMKI